MANPPPPENNAHIHIDPGGEDGSGNCTYVAFFSGVGFGDFLFTVMMCKKKRKILTWGILEGGFKKGGTGKHVDLLCSFD